MRLLNPSRGLVFALLGSLVACSSGGGTQGGPSLDAGLPDHHVGLIDAPGRPQDTGVMHKSDTGVGSNEAGATDASDAGTGHDGATDGSADTGAKDSGGVTADAGFVAVAPPQVIDYGGTVLTTPKVQLIAYAEDTVAPSVVSMIQELSMTSTWATQTGEYGVGSTFTVLPAIMIAGTPPTTLDDNSGNVTPFEQNLATMLSGASPPWGAADPNTIYTFLLPVGTNIESGGSCCSDFLGYHYEAPVGSSNVSYAVVCDCAPFMGDPLTPLQEVTTTVSHELVEAATDPFPSSSTAYSNTDDDDIVWTALTGGEVADMCEYNADANYIPPGSTYMVQRTWSNAAALAGTNPCVPVPSTGPYFNSIPLLPDAVTFQYYGAVQSKGVTIPVGQSKTIDVELYSDGPTSGPWTITAYDMNDYLTGSADNTVSLDKTTGVNGDIVHLTIMATKASSGGISGGFVLQSDLGGQENLSVGAVVN